MLDDFLQELHVDPAILGSERLARYSPVNSDCGRHTSPGF
jgi:hypothetical protein